MRPILCIHGWQDNAASFDTLIPLLPDHVGYLAIDLPGSGFSSRIPNGLLYTVEDEIYIIHYIIKQFGWNKVSLMGHSMGGINCFMYAATFPDVVDFVVQLDSLLPRILSFSYILRQSQSNEMYRQIDERSMSDADPPSYTQEQIIEIMNSQKFSLTRSAAIRLMARGAKESSNEAGRYVFTRDPRLKLMRFLFYTPDVSIQIADRIKCPWLFVKASQSVFHSRADQLDIIVKKMEKKTNFEIVTVEGEHHVHLNDPERVCGAVSEFLLRQRRDKEDSPAEIASKL